MAHVEVNHTAPVVESAEALVSAPIEVVWEVLSDLAGWPTWNPGVTRIHLKGPVAVGTTFHWVAGGSKLVSTLLELNRPVRIAWSGKTMGIRAIHVWTFESTDGGTRVRTEESFEGPVVGLMPWIMRRVLRSALQSGVGALRVEAESRS